MESLHIEKVKVNRSEVSTVAQRCGQGDRPLLPPALPSSDCPFSSPLLSPNGGKMVAPIPGTSPTVAWSGRHIEWAVFPHLYHFIEENILFRTPRRWSLSHVCLTFPQGRPSHLSFSSLYSIPRSEQRKAWNDYRESQLTVTGMGGKAGRHAYLTQKEKVKAKKLTFSICCTPAVHWTHRLVGTNGKAKSWVHLTLSYLHMY